MSKLFMTICRLGVHLDTVIAENGPASHCLPSEFVCTDKDEFGRYIFLFLSDCSNEIFLQLEAMPRFMKAFPP